MTIQIYRLLGLTVVLALSLGNVRVGAAAVAVISEEVEVFRDLFVVSDFDKVDGLIAQYRKRGQRSPQDADGKTLLHYAIPVYSTDKARHHAGFQKIFPELFDRSVRACFKSAKAVVEGSRFVVNCRRYLFYFGVVDGSYRLIEFAADPEVDP